MDQMYNMHIHPFYRDLIVVFTIFFPNREFKFDQELASCLYPCVLFVA